MSKQGHKSAGKLVNKQACVFKIVSVRFRVCVCASACTDACMQVCVAACT